MMPDLTQHGTAETQEWKPVQNTPVIMFDRVSKTYGRINALNSISTSDISTISSLKLSQSVML